VARKGVVFKSANRFYVDDSIALKSDYQKHMEDKYNVQVENLNLRSKVEAANKINNFVEGATDGKIKNLVKSEEIDDDAKSYLINAIYILGKWNSSFDKNDTFEGIFEGHTKRKNDFMNITGRFNVNMNKDYGTVLILDYKDPNFNNFFFFFLMPNECSNLENMRREITG
ncbi:hypothetical protein PENTCL1PPCAC_29131, partial [Pristionchus entomophagus]